MEWTKIETLESQLIVEDKPEQQSCVLHLAHCYIIQLWHDGMRQLMHAIKKRESGIVTTCDKLPEVFVTENLSTIDVRRHSFHLSKTQDGNLRIGYKHVGRDVVLSAYGENQLRGLLNEISLKPISRDCDVLLDDIWYDW
jgi:hypothetical protein